MQMKKLTKKLGLMLMLLLFPFLLTACGSTEVPNYGGSSEESDKKPTIDVSLKQGQVSQSAGLLTVPVLLTNTGTNDTVVSSRNFTLTIQGHEFKPFKIPKSPADFHMGLSSSGIFNDTLSFYLGTTLTKKQLKLVHLSYKMDNGKEKQATQMSASLDQSQSKSSLVNNMTQIGDYYNNILDYMSQAKKARLQGQSPASLNDRFQDSNYDRFRMWVLVNKKDPQNIILQVYNQTNTDIAIPFSDIELFDNNGNELLVDPDYRNAYLCVPHGKFEVISVPLEGKPDMTSDPFKLRVRGRNSSNESYFATDKTYYPIETVITNAKDISKAFALESDQYVKGSIKWSKPVLNFKARSLSVTVELNDLFSLTSNRTKYSLVGIDKDGTDGDIEIPKDVEPTTVDNDDPTQINMKFGDLKVLKSYKHIELRYNKKTLLKIK